MTWQTVEFSDIPFLKKLSEIKVRKDILAKVVNWQLAKRRSGTHNTKEEGDVRGSSRKILRQKGSGRARQGSKKAPHMRGGAVIFGPHPRDYSYRLNKKIRKKGLLHAIASHFQSNNIFVFKDIAIDSFKTKESLANIYKHFDKEAKILFVDEDNDNLLLSIRNYHKINMLPVSGLNVYDILRHDKIVFSEKHLENIEKRVA